MDCYSTRVLRWHRRGSRCYDSPSNAKDASFASQELKPMSEANRFTVVCPCCEATLSIDANTGALVSHEEKHKPLGSFEDMVKDLDKQKQTREQIFAQEMSSHKDRGRLLEEKFQEAKKKAEKDTKIYRNPLDMD
jgi:hypothetical protein